MEHMDDLLLKNNLNKYNDIHNSFKCSISLNSKIEYDIRDISKRFFLNIAKTYISYFNLKYIEIFDEFVKKIKIMVN